MCILFVSTTYAVTNSSISQQDGGLLVPMLLLPLLAILRGAGRGGRKPHLISIWINVIMSLSFWINVEGCYLKFAALLWLVAFFDPSLDGTWWDQTLPWCVWICLVLSINLPCSVLSQIGMAYTAPSCHRPVDIVARLESGHWLFHAFPLFLQLLRYQNWYQINVKHPVSSWPNSSKDIFWVSFRCVSFEQVRNEQRFQMSLPLGNLWKFVEDKKTCTSFKACAKDPLSSKLAVALAT